MPSCAGSGLWLPEVGGLLLYLTLVLTWLRPSSGGLTSTQPAALAALSRSRLAGAGIFAAVLDPLSGAGLFDELELPPETASTTPTITPMTSRLPSRNCSCFWRFAPFAA